MLRKTKEQSSLFMASLHNELTKVSNEAETITQKKISVDEKVAALGESQKAKKMEHKFNEKLSNGHSILSSQAANITDMRGPSKYVGCETGNSIWNPDKIADAAKDIATSAKPKTEKEKIAETRAEIKEKKIAEIADALRSTSLGKASDVASMGTYEGSKYNKPINNLSIFNTTAFDDIPAKTAGEQVGEDVASRKDQKDESWKSNSRPVSSQGIMDRMFENLMKNKEE